MIDELKRQIAAVDAEMKKCGSSPDTELSLCKTLLKGSTEKKDSEGVKKWTARISQAEKNLKEYRKLCLKRKVFKDAIAFLTDDYRRGELNLLDVVREANKAYEDESGEVRHFDVLVKPEDLEQRVYRKLPPSNRSWRHGRMSEIMGGI